MEKSTNKEYPVKIIKMPEDTAKPFKREIRLEDNSKQENIHIAKDVNNSIKEDEYKSYIVMEYLLRR